MSRRLTFSFVKLVTDDFKAITWSLAVFSCLVRTAISRFLFSSAPWWQVTNIAKGTISVRTLVVSHEKFKTGHLRFFLPSLAPRQLWPWGRCPRRRPSNGLCYCYGCGYVYGLSLCFMASSIWQFVKKTDRQRGCLQLFLQTGYHLLLLFHLLPQHPGLENHIRDLKDDFWST